MLQIDNREHYDRVLAFAEKTGQLRHLFERLWFLATYRGWTSDTRPTGEEESEMFERFQETRGEDQSGITGDTIVRLGYDFACASFSILWTWAKDGAAYMNGGLIYHGDQSGWREDGRWTESFNVQLCDSENPWTVNT